MSNTKHAKPASIDDLISSAKLAEHTHRVCLRGDLVAEHERLEAELAALGDWESKSLADADPRLVVAEQLAELEADMAAAEITFVFRALGRRKYKALLEAHPGADGERFNPDTFPQALIAACCIDPGMEPVDVDRLFDVLNTGQVEELFMAAFVVNEGATTVPFSARASEVLARSARK